MARIETYVYTDRETLIKEVALDLYLIPVHEREINLIGDIDKYLVDLLGQNIDGRVHKVYDANVGNVNLIYNGE